MRVFDVGLEARCEENYLTALMVELSSLPGEPLGLNMTSHADHILRAIDTRCAFCTTQAPKYFKTTERDVLAASFMAGFNG